MMRTLTDSFARLSTFCVRSSTHWLKRQWWYRPFHFRYVRWRAEHRGLPNWPMLIGSDAIRAVFQANKKEIDKERILIATGTSGHLPSMVMESLLGITLSVRDYSVDFLICDGSLKACMMCEVNWYSELKKFSEEGPLDRCDSCYLPSKKMLVKAGLPQLNLSSYLSPSDMARADDIAHSIDIDEIVRYEVSGVPVGEHAVAGALRFFARGDLEKSAEVECVLRRYFESALLTYYASKKLLMSGSYKVVVLNHGIYVPQGVMAETAKQLGLRVVTWHPAYRKGCFIFNHNETYHHGFMNESTEVWNNMRWTDGHRTEIEEYLRSRWLGKNGWIKFHKDPQTDIESISAEIGIDFNRPTVGLLTNVVWDAQLHYHSNTFDNMIDWLIKTITYFSNNTHLQLLIRVHPAEITGNIPSRQPAIEEILKVFPKLPENVFIIPPDSRVSTYVAMSRCNAALIYGTKTGVELTASGIPVIVAGEAWIRGKGISHDASSEQEYYQLLDKLPFNSRLDPETQERALKYAYHFFYRRMIPLECMQENAGWPPFKVSVSDISILEPDRSRGLDVIVNGIVSGSPFVYPAEDINFPPTEESVE